MMHADRQSILLLVFGILAALAFPWLILDRTPPRGANHGGPGSVSRAGAHGVVEGAAR
jgi:hypothetical protein